MGDWYKKRRNVFLVFAVFLIGILFYLLNYFTPLAADDYSYLFSMYDGERITNLKDVLLSEYAQYFSWNARILVHTFAQIFLLIGKKYFNIINTFVFILLGLLIYYHSTNLKLKEHISLLMFIYCALFLFTPAFGESFLWLTGACNYMYGIELILIYLIPYTFLRKRAKVQESVYKKSVLVTFLKAVGMLVLGFLAGWTNENTSVALIVIILAFLFYYKVNGIKFTLWMFAGGGGNIAGCIALLFSPGELKRLDTVGGVNFMVLIKNIAKITLNLADYFWPLILLFCLLGFLYMYPKRNIKISRDNIYKEIHTLGVPCIYLVGFFISTYSMSLSPQFPARVWSGPLVLLIIAIASFYTEIVSELDDQKNYFFRFKKLTPLFTACFLCVYAKAFITIFIANINYEVRIEIIEDSIERGYNIVYLPAIISNSKYTCYNYQGDLSWDSSNFVNARLAQYYGFTKIIRDDRAGMDVKSEKLRWFGNYI